MLAYAGMTGGTELLSFLSFLLAGIVDVRLDQEIVGPLEKQRLRRLVAEAIGPALVDDVHRAIGLDVLAERKAHHALPAEFALDERLCKRGACTRGEHDRHRRCTEDPDPRHRILPERLVGHARGLEPWTR
jgi:hypothetical protein